MPHRLHIIGTPPDALARALEIIGEHFHSEADKVFAPAGSSKIHCIRSSLIARDFLLASGLSATVASTPLVVSYGLADNIKPTLAIGLFAKDYGPGKWNGHLTTICAGYMIDLTLAQAIRPRWHALPEMMAVPLTSSDRRALDGSPLRAVASFKSPSGHRLELSWADHPGNQAWLREQIHQEERRQAVVAALIERANASRRHS